MSRFLWFSSRLSEIRDYQFDCRRVIRGIFIVNLKKRGFSHASHINHFLQSLDGILEYRFDGLHDPKSALHIVDLGLHSFNCLHLASYLDKGLTVVQSLENSSSEGFLDIFDGSGLCHSRVSVSSHLGQLGLR